MGIGFQRSWFGLHLSCVKDPVIFPESERARERETGGRGMEAERGVQLD